MGLYLNPPENGLVLSVGEKPNIQALERAQGFLRLSEGKAVNGFSHCFKRRGPPHCSPRWTCSPGRCRRGRLRDAPTLDAVGPVLIRFLIPAVEQARKQETNALVWEPPGPLATCPGHKYTVKRRASSYGRTADFEDLGRPAANVEPNLDACSHHRFRPKRPRLSVASSFQ